MKEIALVILSAIAIMILFISLIYIFAWIEDKFDTRSEEEKDKERWKNGF